VFWREMLILRRRLKRQLASYCVSPLLFIIAFGWGMGRGVSVGGVDYPSYMIPGLMAMSSMSQSFALATEINVARFYLMTFEQLQAAPISAAAIALGEAAAAVVRGVLAAGVIGVIAWVGGVNVHLGDGWVWVGVVMNSAVFGSAAVWAAMVVRSHADQAALNSFFIVPMSFLCGTFFPVERLPGWAAAMVGLLPLTHATRFIRAGALGRAMPWDALGVMGVWAGVFFVLGVWAVRRASL